MIAHEYLAYACALLVIGIVQLATVLFDAWQMRRLDRRLAEIHGRHNRKRDEIGKRYDRDQSSRRG
jgi:hypothetical protein